MRLVALLLTLPLSFVGVYDEDPGGRAREAQVGVGIVRQPLEWSRIERAPGRFDFSPYDGDIAAAARAGVAVLPFLVGPPSFRSRRPPQSRSRAMYPPRSNAAFAAFARAAVERYGPSGSFWREHPEVPFLPVHSWQVWNEPNIRNWWRSGPSARAYTRMLRAAYPAITAADPNAEVVAGGLPNSNLGLPFLRFLNGMYRAGAARWFDTLAIHPYSRDVHGLLRLVEWARLAMNRHGDRARLWITELGWSTGGDASAFRVTRRGQADRIAAALSALIAERRALRLRGLVVFKWRDALPPPGAGSDPWPLHAGLLDETGAAKPAYDRFARIVASLRSPPPGDGSAAGTTMSRGSVRLSPLGFAAVQMRCRSAACAGRLSVRSASAVACGGTSLRAGAVVGATTFRIVASTILAPVRLRVAARRLARCLGALRVRATAATGTSAVIRIRSR